MRLVGIWRRRRRLNNVRLSDESVMEGRHLTPEERIALQAEEIKQLQQENEQLRAQVARMREALRKARETISAWDRVNWFECDRCKNMRDALATIDKAIGCETERGKEG